MADDVIATSGMQSPPNADVASPSRTPTGVTIPENRFLVPRNDRGRESLSRKAKAQVENPFTQQEYDECEAGPYPHDLGLNEDDQQLVYMVRVFRPQYRGNHIFEARVQGSREKEIVTREWLNANGMNAEWRKKTIMSNVGYWYRVPVANTFDKNKAWCAVKCVEKALSYMGLFEKIDKFLSSSNFVLEPFFQVVSALQSAKGFTQHTIKQSPSTAFDPVLHCQNGKLYVIQIRARKKSNCLFTDNAHAICVFNKRIFDVNHCGPLQLDYGNLARCCLNGPQSESWVYDASVRVAVFTPTKRTDRRIQMYMKDILSSTTSF